jgi:hypothetical protein
MLYEMEVSALSSAVPLQTQLLDEMLLLGTRRLTARSLADWAVTTAHRTCVEIYRECLNVTYNTVSLHTELITVKTVVLMLHISCR